MTGIRKAIGSLLMGLGLLGILLCVGLVVYILFFVPEMSTDKKLSESAITLVVAAWFGGLVVAGKILRRK